MEAPKPVGTVPRAGRDILRPASWNVLVLSILAALPGVAIVAAAFSVFERIYSFLPITDVILIGGYGALLSGILVYAARDGRRTGESPAFAFALAIGFGLAVYTMGGWELSWAAYLFTGVSVLAYVGVSETSHAVGRKKVAWGIASALIGLGLGILPAVLIVQGIWTAVIYQPDLMRDVGFAGVLAISASAAFLGLAAGFVRGPAGSRVASPL